MTRGVRFPREQPIRTSASSALRPRTPASETQEVCEQSIRPRDAAGQLPEEAQTCVHVHAFAERRDEQAALERRLARVVRLEERHVGRVPVVCEVQPTLLYPPLPVRGAD